MRLLHDIFFLLFIVVIWLNIELLSCETTIYVFLSCFS
jgi:hypothetical protein